MSSIISIKNLNKTFKSFSLKDINLEIEEGCIYGFIGRNGAGKTTLIKHLLGLMRIESGSIHIFGKEFNKHEVEIKQEIGFVLDDTPFLQHLSGKQNKNLIAPFYKNWDESYFQQLAEKFEINLKQNVAKYSKGEKMKLAIAIAMSHHPKLLILDEPTSGLDPVFRVELLEMLQEFILSRDCTIFFSTHITSDLDQIGDYICMIQDGEIAFQKEKDALLDDYRIIRGKKNDIDYWQTKTMNLKIHDFGFEALIKNKYLLDEDHHDLIMQRASIQDIMVHYLGRNQFA